MRDLEQIGICRPLKLVSFLQKLDRRLSPILILLAAAGTIPIILFSGTPQFNLYLFLLCLIPVFAGLALMPVSGAIRRELKEHEERVAWQATHKNF